VIIKYENGNLIIDAHELFDHIDPDKRLEVVESLSCNDTIIKHVTDQLLDGWTENCFCGATGSGSVEPYTILDKAKREIAKRSGEVAKREIERLETALDRKTKEFRGLEDELRLVRDQFEKRNRGGYIPL
jgi:hypothetical protein